MKTGRRKCSMKRLHFALLTRRVIGKFNGAG
jgi:hypothetical protein